MLALMPAANLKSSRKRSHLGTIRSRKTLGSTVPMSLVIPSGCIAPLQRAFRTAQIAIARVGTANVPPSRFLSLEAFGRRPECPWLA